MGIGFVLTARNRRNDYEDATHNRPVFDCDDSMFRHFGLGGAADICVRWWRFS